MVIYQAGYRIARDYSGIEASYMAWLFSCDFNGWDFMGKIFKKV